LRTSPPRGQHPPVAGISEFIRLISSRAPGGFPWGLGLQIRHGWSSWKAPAGLRYDRYRRDSDWNSSSVGEPAEGSLLSVGGKPPAFTSPDY